MCGIVGYVGKEQRCVEVLMDGLRNLEYRGYDSAGLSLALPEAGGIETTKEVGPLDNLAGTIGRRNGDFFRVRAGVGQRGGRPTAVPARPTSIHTRRVALGEMEIRVLRWRWYTTVSSRTTRSSERS